MSSEYERTQEDEMTLAYGQKRQPGCVYCRHPLDRVTQPQDEEITWTWDKILKQYKKSEDGIAERPFHDCGKCEGGCQAKDWAYLDDKYIDF